MLLYIPMKKFWHKLSYFANFSHKQPNLIENADRQIKNIINTKYN